MLCSCCWWVGFGDGYFNQREVAGLLKWAGRLVLGFLLILIFSLGVLLGCRCSAECHAGNMNLLLPFYWSFLGWSLWKGIGKRMYKSEPISWTRFVSIFFSLLSVLGACVWNRGFECLRVLVLPSSGRVVCASVSLWLSSFFWWDLVVV